jgi:formylglycine-generating enzyme required for sulfatase activity
MKSAPTFELTIRGKTLPQLLPTKGETSETSDCKKDFSDLDAIAAAKTRRVTTRIACWMIMLAAWFHFAPTSSAVTLTINREVSNIVHHFTPARPQLLQPGSVTDELVYDKAGLTNVTLSSYGSFELRFFAPPGQMISVNCPVTNYNSFVYVDFTAGNDSGSHGESELFSFENLTGNPPVNTYSLFFIGDAGNFIEFGDNENYTNNLSFTAMKCDHTPAWNPPNTPKNFASQLYSSIPVSFSYATMLTNDPGPFVTMGGVAAKYDSQLVAIPNLLGYWPFTSDYQANSSVNGYTGTFQGNALIGLPASGPPLFDAITNAALVLDRTNQSFVNTSLVGLSPGTGANTNQGSIVAWFKLDNLPSITGTTFYIAGESQFQNDLDLQIETDNQLKFFTDNGSSTVDTFAFTTNDLGVWHFVVATFTTGVSRNVYLDGQLLASSVPGGHTYPGNGTFAVGESDVFNNRYFQGSIARVAVFNRALSAAEVTGLYAAAGIGTCPISGIVLRPDGNLQIPYYAPPNSTNFLQATTSLQLLANWQIVDTNIAGAEGTGHFDNISKGSLLPIFFRVQSQVQHIYFPPPGMAIIPAGSFTIGDTLDGMNDAIPTNVYVSGFYMDVNLVSYGLWTNVYSYASANAYSFVHTGAGKGNATYQPIQTVDWYDCVKWCNARSAQAGLVPVYYTDAGLTQVYKTGEVAPYVNRSANGYRLPTEAEWEKAARGGLSGQRFPWGNTISESQANYLGETASYSYDLGPNGYNVVGSVGGTPMTSPVGSFAANGYGLYDMAGNVFEWCWDWYGGQPYLAGSPYLGGSDPQGVDPGIFRVLRGGHWFADASSERCAARSGNIDPSNAYHNFGFRCVRGTN